MKTNRVYLAGPITGLSYADGQDWRLQAKTILSEMGITAFSPLRNKNYLDSIGKIPALVDRKDVHRPLSTPKGIVTRDVHDVMSADALLVNLIGTEAVSIGTVMEIAIAYSHRKPMVLAMEPDNIHEHPFVLEMCGFRVETLQDAIDLVGDILLP